MTIRRLKTYTGSQGYVYQYYFVGQQRASEAITEYVFDVTSDRKNTFPVHILLPHSAVNAWNQIHGRELSQTEQYAAVKLRLFQAFDESEGRIGDAIHVDLAFLERSLSGLGIS